MLPLARFWTWVGQIFIPLALAWAYFVRNGKYEGVLISRGYLGLIVTLLAGSTLAWTLGAFVQKAKSHHESPLIPPNTMFEDDKNRNLALSWGTLVVFAAVVLAALLFFSARYSTSQIYRWDDPRPLDNSFLGSRAKAHQDPCADRSCFAMGQRVDSKGVIDGVVFQYIPYLTDGGLALLGIIQLAGLIFLLIAVRRPTQPWQIDL